MPRLPIVTLRYTFADVPERCPHCDADFVSLASPSLREVNLAEAVFRGSITTDGTQHHFDVAEAGALGGGEFHHPVSYQCDVCGHDVAGTGVPQLGPRLVAV